MASVSIIIPFYNNEKTLKACIQSAIDQSIEKSEIILVNNNSSDQSHSIAQSFTNEHTNVFLHNCNQQGSAHARNLGLQKANNDFIQFLDADDILLENKINYQLKENPTDADIIVSPYVEIAANNKIQYVTDKNIWRALILGKLGITSSNLFKKSAIEAINGWSITQINHQDYELMFRLLKNQAVVAFDENSLTIKNNRASNSISAETVKLYPKIGIELRQNIQDFLHKNSLLTPELTVALNRYYYDKISWLYKYEEEEAVKLYTLYFKDRESRSVIPLKNRIMESIFGFSNARKIKNFLSIK